jgi:hypothetical protein
MSGPHVIEFYLLSAAIYNIPAQKDPLVSQ